MMTFDPNIMGYSFVIYMYHTKEVQNNVIVHVADDCGQSYG